MPPHLPRKRLRSASPGAKPQHKRKPTLYDDLDASTASNSAQAASVFLSNDTDDSSSSLSSLSDEDFEDVAIAKRAPPEDEDEDEDVEFEDVVAPKMEPDDTPIATGDLELTLVRDDRISLTNLFGDKRGPSKRERLVRNATHRMHVLCLLWHNAVRNSWICDKELQAIMLSHLPTRMWDEVERWRLKSGLEQPQPVKAKGKGRATKGRDWGQNAKRLEEGVPDMSNGDPLFRLAQTLMSWWKQRFRITTPGLRKWGYMALERLDRLRKAYEHEDNDATKFGECIREVKDLRECAARCEGSRDVGTYLFTALLRGLGLDVRLVANLQCLGYAWSKLEDAELEDKIKNPSAIAQVTPQKPGKSKVPIQGRGSWQKSKRPAKSKPSKDTELELEYQDSDDESVVEVQITPVKSSKPKQKIDVDLEFANYWTEILSPVTGNFLSVEPIVKGVVATNRELVESLEPRGAKADNARQVMAYVVAYSSDGTAKDVTVRYLKKRIFPGRTKGTRYPLEKIPIYNRHGKVQRHEHYDWFKSAMSGYKRGSKKCPITDIDEVEENTDLKPAVAERKPVQEGEETLQYYKQSKDFVLERHLKREEALRPGAKPVKKFKNKGKNKTEEEEDVYLRLDVLNVKSAETWHKQGRAPLAGEEPLKRVPYRAATTNRRREILEAEAATGQKVLQGLYSYDQTDWIIPDPIKDGVIPKNEYGNIDMFAEHMCPKGAVHVPFKGTVKVCKKLQIDYAEAVVDFEFGHRMAVPVIQGVVIAEENHDMVMEQLQIDEAERMRKEDEKRRKAALGQWRKFIMGMRIVQRIRQEYGEIDDKVSVFGHSSKHAPSGAPELSAVVGDEEMAGGFLPEGYEEEEGEEGSGDAQPSTSHFFPVVDENEADDEGDILLEHEE